MSSHGIEASSNKATSELSEVGEKLSSLSLARYKRYIWLMWGISISEKASMMVADAFVSSLVSLRAPCWVVSLFSRNPAGSVQKPKRGSIARLQSKTLFSHSGMHPTMTLGFSYWMKLQLSHVARGRLSPSGTLMVIGFPHWLQYFMVTLFLFVRYLSHM